jgi:S1-C subfamily serine protease
MIYFSSAKNKLDVNAIIITTTTNTTTNNNNTTILYYLLLYYIYIFILPFLILLLATGLAIPIDTIKVIVNILIRDGGALKTVNSGIDYITGFQAKLLGISQGLVVMKVRKNSPADFAGTSFIYFYLCRIIEYLYICIYTYIFVL